MKKVMACIFLVGCFACIASSVKAQVTGQRVLLKSASAGNAVKPAIANGANNGTVSSPAINQNSKPAVALPANEATKRLLPGGFVAVKMKLPFTTEEKEYVVQTKPIQGTPYFNYILDGDIIVGNNLNENKTYAVSDSRYLWQGDIPVVLDKSVGDSSMCEKVNRALAIIERNTKIHFVVRSNQPDYIQIRIGDPGGFYGGISAIGRRGGMQELVCSKGVNVGVIVHETLHAMGFYHEQSRKDRDNYVQIVWANIKDSAKYNFNIVPGNYLGTYDYISTMHYFSTSFTKNGMPTINCVEGGKIVPCPNRMGQQDDLSPQDVTSVNALYKSVNFSPSRNTIAIGLSAANNTELKIIVDTQSISLPPGIAVNDVVGVNVRLPGSKLVRNNICDGSQEFAGYNDYSTAEATTQATALADYINHFKVTYVTVTNLPKDKSAVSFEPFLKINCLPGTLNKNAPTGKKMIFKAVIEQLESSPTAYMLTGVWFDYGSIPPAQQKGFQLKQFKSDGPINQPGVEPIKAGENLQKSPLMQRRTALQKLKSS